MTEHYKVPFSIGKYCDEIYCDMVDMDACHILFGHLWQYNMDAKYMCRKNVYQLEKGGVKYTLVPFARKNQPKTSKVEGRSFLTIVHEPTTFIRECKEMRDVHLLVVKGEAGSEELEGHLIPVEVQELLEEFEDVVSDDLPMGLPPMRDI